MGTGAGLVRRGPERGRSLTVLAACGVSAAALLLVQPQSQAVVSRAPAPVPEWGPVTTVVRDGAGVDLVSPPAERMAMAAGPKGEGIVVLCDGRGRLQATRLTGSGRWSFPRTVGPCGSSSAPTVGLDRSGRATAVWIHRLDVLAASQPAGGRWSRPRMISPPTPDPSDDVIVGVFEVDLAVSPRGVAAAAWKVDSMDTDVPITAQVATRAPGRPWGRARTVDADTHGSDHAPRVAVRLDGDVVVVYDDEPEVGEPGPRRLVARERIVGQGWRPASVVTTATTSRSVWSWDVAVGGGSTAVAWTNASGAQRLARRTAGGGWTEPIRLAPAAAADRARPALAVDGAGTATVAWKQEGVARTRTVDTLGNVSPVTRLGRARGLPSLAGNPAGDAVLAWRSRARVVRVAYRPSARPWVRPVALGPGAFVTAALRPNGDALAVWQRGERRLVSSQAR